MVTLLDFINKLKGHDEIPRKWQNSQICYFIAYLWLQSTPVLLFVCRLGDGKEYLFQAKDEVRAIYKWFLCLKKILFVCCDSALSIIIVFVHLKAEMSSWIQSILSSIPTGSGDSPGGPRALSRAMTMPPISPSSGDAGGVTMRNKEGKEKDREKRFSFFGKKK